MRRIIFFLLMIGAQYSFAQSDTTNRNYKNKIGLELGYNRAYLKDIVFSPLNYSGGGSLISLNYERIWGENKSMFLADFNLISNSFNTAASSLLTSHLFSGGFELGFLRRTKINANNKSSLFLGGSYISDINYLDWLGASQSYFATHSLAFKGIFRFQVKPNHLLQTSLTIPVTHIFVRPSYNIFDKNTQELFEQGLIRLVFKGKLASFDSYLGVFWKTNYTLRLSRRWDLDLSYSMNYKRTFEENKFINLSNVFSSSIIYKF